jgi:tetratricopeptide (TPR) repeat protein
MGRSGDSLRGYVQEGLAIKLLELGEYSRSEDLLRDSIRLYQSTDANQRYFAAAEYFLGECLLAQGRSREAESLFRSALARIEETEVPHWRIQRLNGALGEALYRQGEAIEGSRLIIESHRWLSQDPTAKAAAVKKSHERLKWISRLAKVDQQTRARPSIAN